MTAGTHPGRRLDRRHCLLALSAVGSMLALPWRWNPRTLPLAERLARQIEHRESAQAIGAAFLRKAGEAISAAALADAIGGTGPAERARLAHVSDEELRQYLAARVIHDFATENIVMVEGWTLSRTEAQLAALVCLTDRRSA